MKKNMLAANLSHLMVNRFFYPLQRANPLRTFTTVTFYNKTYKNKKGITDNCTSL
jgi:hypothetical protein